MRRRYQAGRHLRKDDVGDHAAHEIDRLARNDCRERFISDVTSPACRRRTTAAGQRREKKEISRRTRCRLPAREPNTCHSGLPFRLSGEGTNPESLEDHRPFRWSGGVRRKVSQAFGSPLSKPRLNHWTRCAEVPCVNFSGDTWPPALFWSAIIADALAAWSRLSTSPGSSDLALHASRPCGPHAGVAVGLQLEFYRQLVRLIRVLALQPSHLRVDPLRCCT